MATIVRSTSGNRFAGDRTIPDHDEGVAFAQLRIVACRAKLPAWALKVKSMPSIRTLEEWVSDLVAKP
jgi:hypothetical protein